MDRRRHNEEEQCQGRRLPPISRRDRVGCRSPVYPPSSWLFQLRHTVADSAAAHLGTGAPYIHVSHVTPWPPRCCAALSCCVYWCPDLVHTAASGLKTKEM